MKHFTLILLALAFVFSACKKEDEVLPSDESPTETSGEVAFHMHFLADGEEIVAGESHELNGMEVVFNRIQFYIYDFTFYADHMMTDSIQVGGNYWLAGLDNQHVNIGDVEMSHVHMIKFKIGVDPVTNSQSSADFIARPADDPLSAQTPPMHWSWGPGQGYKFAVFEGTYNDGANSFVYHCATDALLRESDAISLHTDLDPDSTTEIHLMVNLTEVFTGIDIASTSTAHGAQPTNVALMDHLAGAFSVME